MNLLSKITLTTALLAATLVGPAVNAEINLANTENSAEEQPILNEDGFEV
ncbi:hypothetical protein ACFC3A_13035 [Enterococcus thailandicus]